MGSLPQGRDGPRPRVVAPKGPAGGLARKGEPGAGGKPKKGKLTYIAPAAQGIYIDEDWLPSPSWKLSETSVQFWKEGRKVLEFSRRQEESQQWRKLISFPAKPAHIMEDPRKGYPLPTPMVINGKPVVPKELEHYPILMMKPQIARILDHVDHCDCIQAGQHMTFHRPCVVPDICLKSVHVDSAGLNSVQPPSIPLLHPLVENPSHYYFFSKLYKDHLLAVPQPWRNNAPWLPLVHQPTMAGDKNPGANALFYSLYDTERAVGIASAYQTPPDKWTNLSHPCLAEPLPGSELHFITKNLYGIETVPRMNYTCHPLSEPRVPIYLAADPETLLVPVFVTDARALGLLEQTIARLLAPFWKFGHGRALCPVCLLKTDGGLEFDPVFLTRSEFKSHWMNEHLASYVASSTFSATGLHVRLYMGHYVYQIITALDATCDDIPADAAGEPAIDTEVIRDFLLWERSSVLSVLPRRIESSESSASGCSLPKISAADEALLDSENHLMHEDVPYQGSTAEEMAVHSILDMDIDFPELSCSSDSKKKKNHKRR